MKTCSDGSDTTKSEDNSKQKVIEDSKTSIKTNIKTTNCENNNRYDNKNVEKQFQEIKFNQFKENDIKQENQFKNNKNNNQREETSNPFLKNFQLRKTNSIYW